MRSLEQRLNDKGYKTSPEKEKEIIMDNELLLRSNTKDKAEKAIKNLCKLYYEDFWDDNQEIRQIVELFVRSL